MDYAAMRERAKEHAARKLAVEREKSRAKAAKDAAIAAEEQRKERILKETIESNRREKLEREQARMKEEERKATVLPKSRNLYGQRQEMAKKNKQRSEASSSTARAPLSREEKQAQKRRKLFEQDDDDEMSAGMVLAQLQKQKQERSPHGSPSLSRMHSPSTFSPRDGKNTSSSSISTMATNGAKSTLASGSKITPKRPITKSNGQSKTFAALPLVHSGSVRDRLVASFSVGDLRKLNPQKRDTRTIDEIEADMKKRKAGMVEMTVKSEVIGIRRGDSNRGHEIQTMKRSASTNRQSNSVSHVGAKRSKLSASSHQNRASSESVSDSSTDTRARPSEVSRTIQSMFRGKNRPTHFNDYSDEDDDMESSTADLQREEYLAERFAREEDDRETRVSNLKAQEKQRRLKGRS